MTKSNEEEIESVEKIVNGLRVKYPQANVYYATMDKIPVSLVFQLGKYCNEIPIYRSALIEYPLIERLINPFHHLSFQQLNEYCEKESVDCIQVYSRNIVDVVPLMIIVDKVFVSTNLIPTAIRCATLEELGEVVIRSALEGM